ncbi:MAG: hypothetical protein ABWY56_14430 [Propionibacteriaceae bacterium]
MSVIDLHPAALTAAAEDIPAGQPVTMLNLLRYRPQAEYGNGSTLPPVSGREAYFTRYLPAFDLVAKPYGLSRPVWLGHVTSHLVAPDGAAWDDIALIEYPDFDIFRAIVTSDAYARNAHPHREAALQDWLFLSASPLQLP